MKRFRWRTFAARTATVDADQVSFEPSGHVAFWTADGRLVLAVRTEDCDQLTESEETV